MENLIKFETGNIYEMRFIGDSDLRPLFICTKRTEKMVTLEKYCGSEIISKKIKIWNGIEYILEGSYSMAPRISAENLVG